VLEKSMVTQPRLVQGLIFVGVILMLAGFALLLMPWIIGVVPAYIFLGIGIIALVMAGCTARR
jgi:hypothetical protein